MHGVGWPSCFFKKHGASLLGEIEIAKWLLRFSGNQIGKHQTQRQKKELSKPYESGGKLNPLAPKTLMVVK